MKKITFLTLAILILMLSQSAVFHFVQSGKANSDGLSDWQYRKNHVINPASGAGTNYQVRIVAHYGSGTDNGGDVYLNSKCREDFGDVRFLTAIQEAEYYRIAVPSDVHNSYGLGYPVTYVFGIPSEISTLKAYKRTGTVWEQLTERVSEDFFNGIECVRFDHTNNKAYVNVAFAEDSDYIDVKITDQNGETILSWFEEIAEYYDNRKAVFVAAADDLDGNENRHNAFMTVCDVFQSGQVWLTLGIVSQGMISEPPYAPPEWNAIQEQINEGFIEAASHSRTHQGVPYSDYDGEIGGVKDDIIGNLSLPLPYKKGVDEYVWAWLEPYGVSDNTARQKLGEYEYLADRKGDIKAISFASWDNVNGLYNRVDPTECADWSERTPEYLNAAFDNAYTSGGIYHLAFHAINFDWSGENVITQHLDYIKNRKDVWYVGFGALSAYHYVQERGVVTVTPTYSDRFEQVLLDYWMEEKVDGDHAVFSVEIPGDLSSQAHTIYVYYGNSGATTTSNGEATFLFFDDFDDNTFDTDKWDSVGTGTITESNQELGVESASGEQYGKAARAKTAFPIGNGVMVEGEYYRVGGGEWTEVWWVIGKAGTEDNSDAGASFGFLTCVRVGYADGYFFVQKRVDRTPTTLTYFERTSPPSYISGKFVVTPSTMTFYEGDTSVGSWAHNVFTSSDLIKASTSTAIGGIQYRDSIRVRKYVSPEPSHGRWGSEEISDSVLIDQVFVSDDRADVGSVQTVGFHAKWNNNGSDVVGGSIYANNTEHTSNSTGWVAFNVNSPFVRKDVWIITGVNCNGVTTHMQTAPAPSIVWDQIKIIEGDTTRKSLTLGETTTIWFKAIYEYGNTVFTSANGTLYLNGSAMTWSPTNTRWECTYTVTTMGPLTFTISGVHDESHGLTMINDTVGTQTINVWSAPFSVISNSTISALTFNSTSKTLAFTVSGPTGTTGYTNVIIAKTLVVNITDLRVHLDGSPLEYSTNSTTDSWIIEFAYGHSTHRIVIALNSMTESAPTAYPTTYMLLALLIATLILATVIKKKKPYAYSIRARHGNSPGQTELFFIP